MLLYVQTWGPDTCECLVHQAGDQDAPIPWQSWRQAKEIASVTVAGLDIYMPVDPPALGQRIMRYVTYQEAQQIHLAHYWARPASTNQQIWWQMPTKSQMRKGRLPKSFIALVQPKAKLCRWHQHLGHTQEMYDTVDELNWRKNTSCWLAWKVGNSVSDEDLMWVAQGKTTPHPFKEPGTSRIFMRTEREQRMLGLVTVFPLTAVSWKVNQPGDQVELEYLRDWLPSSGADAIQHVCDKKWGRDRVLVT